MTIKFFNHSTDSLEGKLLLASPDLRDSVFSNAVIFIVKHDKDTSMGLIINKTNSKLNFQELTTYFDIPKRKIKIDTTTKSYFGGPVNVNCGFILHGNDYHTDNSVKCGDFTITSSLKAFNDITKTKGPKDFLMIFGYAAWVAGQLEDEITNHDWLVTDPDYKVIFNKNSKERWNTFYRSIGINSYCNLIQGGNA